jgi:hypothetical protein
MSYRLAAVARHYDRPSGRIEQPDLLSQSRSVFFHDAREMWERRDRPANLAAQCPAAQPLQVPVDPGRVPQRLGRQGDQLVTVPAARRPLQHEPVHHDHDGATPG